MDGRTYSQRKRDKLDYRAEYFKHNPGLFGCIWTCAYCHRPLVGRKNVQVDHIMPLNNPLGRNARYNLVAACAVCNNRKSDKVDYRVAQGYMSKIFEMIIFTIQKMVIIAVVGVWSLVLKAFALLKQAIVLPFCKTSMTTKVIAAVIYAAVIIYIYKSF